MVERQRCVCVSVDAPRLAGIVLYADWRWPCPSARSFILKSSAQTDRRLGGIFTIDPARGFGVAQVFSALASLFSGVTTEAIGKHGRPTEQEAATRKGSHRTLKHSNNAGCWLAGLKRDSLNRTPQTTRTKCPGLSSPLNLLNDHAFSAHRTERVSFAALNMVNQYKKSLSPLGGPFAGANFSTTIHEWLPAANSSSLPGGSRAVWLPHWSRSNLLSRLLDRPRPASCSCRGASFPANAPRWRSWM